MERHSAGCSSCGSSSTQIALFAALLQSLGLSSDLAINKLSTGNRKYRPTCLTLRGMPRIFAALAVKAELISATSRATAPPSIGSSINTASKTDKRSGITHDPNGYGDDPQYILKLIERVITVSLRTVDIGQELPQLPLGDDLEGVEIAPELT